MAWNKYEDKVWVFWSVYFVLFPEEKGKKAVCLEM